MSIYYLGHPNTRYFAGECPLFAIALHHLSGLPLAAIIEGPNLIHAFVYMDEKTIIDAAGYTSVDDVLNEFPHWGETTLVGMTEKELLTIGYGNANVTMPAQVMRDALAVLNECEIALLPGVTEKMFQENADIAKTELN